MVDVSSLNQFPEFLLVLHAAVAHYQMETFVSIPNRHVILRPSEVVLNLEVELLHPHLSISVFCFDVAAEELVHKVGLVFGSIYRSLDKQFFKSDPKLLYNYSLADLSRFAFKLILF